MSRFAHFPTPRRRLLIVSLVAFLSLAGTCLGPLIVSDGKEQELGVSIAQEVEANPEFHLLGDAEVDAYITELSLKVIEASPRQRDFPFSFKVVINPEINAFALPGGYCYVHTGLIQAAESESELVGVIAHEVSHVTCGHHRNMIANQFVVDTAQGVLVPENSAIIGAAANVVSGVGLLKFSRSQEAQADDVGADAMWRAGWDPRGLKDFFEKLREMEGRDPGRVEMLFRSHPATGDRVEALEALAQSFPPRDDLISDTPRFHFIQARVNDLLGQ